MTAHSVAEITPTGFTCQCGAEIACGTTPNQRHWAFIRHSDRESGGSQP